MLNSCQGLKSYNAVLRPKIAQWVELHVKIIKDLSSQQEKRTVSPNPLKRFKPKTHIRRFVPGLASVISGLSKLLKKGGGGGWIHLGNWAAGSFSEDRIMNYLPTLQVPVRGWPLLLYLASNFQAIGALLAQEDNDGNEQPIYYVSKTLRDTETRYPKIEMVCLVVIYASQRLKWYFSAHQILLVTKSHPIKTLFH